MNQEILTALKAIEAKIERRTPVSFRWTPAMQAIWPLEYRPTMSGLLAIWEAMQGAACYYQEPLNERPPYPDGEVVGPCVCGSWPGGKCLHCEWRQASPKPLADDGWIEHIAGEPCPVPRGTKIDVRDADGCVWEDVAALENPATEKKHWTGLGITKMDSLITAWRPSK